MTQNIISTIENLVTIPSPTGYTDKIISFIKNELEILGYNTVVTNKGALYVTVKGEDTSKERFVTAHVDTLGGMVKYIKSDGRLAIDLVGGFSYNSIEGENCIVHLNDGTKISGTILLHQNSVHVYKEARTLERNQDNMEIRLDIVSSSKEDTIAAGVNIGDFISFDPRVTITDTGFIKSRHLDDKVSVAILMNILKHISQNNLKLPVTTTFYFSNNEEIGYGGNSNISDKVVEYLAVDMGAMGDGQATDEYSVSICVKDSSGPYHYELRNKLINLCIEHNIDYRLDIYPYYGSDASAAVRAGYDIKHALLGAGIESSHAYERTHIKSIMHTYHLVEKYLFSSL